MAAQQNASTEQWPLISLMYEGPIGLAIKAIYLCFLKSVGTWSLL